ncbi:MAG: hypothetical protein ACHQK9_13520, partial [Reyranellales bacterium]
IFGGWHWGGHGNSYVNVNVNRAVNIDRSFNATRINNGVWQHDVDHRKGVAYREPTTRQQYGQTRPGVDQREQYRGRTANAPATQPARPPQTASRPNIPQQPTARPNIPQQGNVQRPATTQRPANLPAQRSGALGGVDRGQQVNREAARGRAQQTRTVSPPAGGGGGARAATPAARPAAPAARPAGGGAPGGRR